MTLFQYIIGAVLGVGMFGSFWWLLGLMFGIPTTGLVMGVVAGLAAPFIFY